MHELSLAGPLRADKAPDGVWEYNRIMTKHGLAGVLIVVLLAFAGVMVWFAGAVRQATEPVAQVSNGLATQVSQLLHPTPTVRPDPVTIVREVRALSRLETIQYSVEKVITAETGQGPFGFLFGDRLLLVAHGTVIAGIDLGAIALEDVWFDDVGRLHLRLPPPEIFVATLDNSQTYVYDRDTGLLTKGTIDLESVARRAAEAEMRTAALEDGILDQAQLNAEAVLFRLLRALGFVDVMFVETGSGE
jgi:hypothetical protein